MKGDIVRHRVRTSAVAVVFGLLLAAAAPAAVARPIPQGPTVELGSSAGLKCPERWTVTQTRVTVSQSQASGQASFPLTCTGSFQSFNVTVSSSGAPFELGDAQMTASVVTVRGRTEQAQDSDVMRLDPTVVVDLAGTARLAGSGEAVSIDVTTACPVGANGQQSYVNVSQGETVGNGQFVPTCDGGPHTVTVSVHASRGVYRLGSAQGLTFAFIEAGGNGFSNVDESAVEIVG